jgi:hypothetical protein
LDLRIPIAAGGRPGARGQPPLVARRRCERATDDGQRAAVSIKLSTTVCPGQQRRAMEANGGESEHVRHKRLSTRPNMMVWLFRRWRFGEASEVPRLRGSDWVAIVGRRIATRPGQKLPRASLFPGTSVAIYSLPTSSGTALTLNRVRLAI